MTGERRERDTPWPRVESLTGLRWWAAFGVFAHHMTNLAPLPIYSPLKFGTSGVTFFFVLSGFLLTWSARPGIRIRTFYRRRFARIWPTHLLTLIPAVLVFYSLTPDPQQDWVKPVSIGILVLSPFLLQGWSNDLTVLYSGNPVSWTLSVEAFFYTYHPFVLRPTAKLRVVGGLTLCVAVVAAGAAYRLLLSHWPLPSPPQPVMHSVAFLCGIGLAIALRSGWRPRVPVWIAYVVVAAGLLILWCAVQFPAYVPLAPTLRTLQREAFTLLFGFLILAVASRDLRGGRSLLRSRPLVALGKWSYSFYLIHSTILYAIKEYRGSSAPVAWSNLTWYAVVCGMSVVAAWLLYTWVEYPLERRIRATRRSRGEQGRPQADVVRRASNIPPDRRLP